MRPSRPRVIDRNEFLTGSNRGLAEHFQITPQEIKKSVFIQLPKFTDGHPGKPSYLESLGASYMEQFKKSGKIQDIDEAISLISRALWLSPKKDPNLPKRLNCLSGAYFYRFERLGESQNLDASISCIFLAAALAPADEPTRPGYLANLGTAYESRSKLFGDVSDVQKSISLQAEAISLVPDSHKEKSVWLSNLGISYTNRFGSLGALEDIDNAINCLNRADQLNACGQRAKSMCLNNLGRAYRIRFERLGDIEDIHKAIHHSTRAVNLSPDGHPNKPAQLHNLGVAYFLRFGAVHDLEDLNLAIEYEGNALSLAPEGHAELPTQLNDLGFSYCNRFEYLHNLEDVERSIACHTQSVSLTPTRHERLPNRLSNLGVAYCCRFELLRERHDIDKAITYSTQATGLTPMEHADRASRANRLGKMLALRHLSFGDSKDLELALTHCRAAAQSASSHPKDRYQASLSWVRYASRRGISAQLPAYMQAMKLVPQHVWIGTTVAGRYKSVGHVATLATGAASVAISSGNLNLALEWLEQGRSIVWKQMLQLRTPLEELAAKDSDLARKLERVAETLDRTDFQRPGNDTSSTTSFPSEQAAQHRRRSAEAWSQLLQQAQQLPGFSDFMQPKRASELMLTAHSGAVAVINVHTTRCDALIILPDKNRPIRVPLPDFSHQKAITARTKLLGYLQAKGLVARGFKVGQPGVDTVFIEVLALLWSDIAKPILEFLGYTKKPSTGQLPRVTWCTTGALSFLPLHAAGHYDRPGANVMDLVISSYTPTLSTLLLPIKIVNDFSGILAVGQSDARPGLSDLPGTVAELNQIKEQAGELPFLQIDGKNATVEAVLSGLDKHSWVHFACHAKQNSEDPISSALYLHDGSLDLASITRKSNKRGAFAFLSACQTATGDENMPDESVHLAAGMIMAGYPTVVATMWSVVDDDAPLIAKEVYARLLEGGKPDSRRAAEALHSAVQCLRSKVGNKAFMRWIPYVHMGI